MNRFSINFSKRRYPKTIAKSKAAVQNNVVGELCVVLVTSAPRILNLSINLSAFAWQYSCASIQGCHYPGKPREKILTLEK